jgi:hypothetical protein
MDGLTHHRSLQLTGMADVGHECNVPAGGSNLLEEPKQVVGIGIRYEPIGPVAEGFGPESDAPDMIQRGVQEGFHIPPEDLRSHDQRVSTGDKDAVYFPMKLKVPDQGAGFVGLEPKPVGSGELGPPETIGAV